MPSFLCKLLQYLADNLKSYKYLTTELQAVLGFLLSGGYTKIDLIQHIKEFNLCNLIVETIDILN